MQNHMPFHRLHRNETGRNSTSHNPFPFPGDSVQGKIVVGLADEANGSNGQKESISVPNVSSNPVADMNVPNVAEIKVEPDGKISSLKKFEVKLSFCFYLQETRSVNLRRCRTRSMVAVVDHQSNANASMQSKKNKILFVFLVFLILKLILQHSNKFDFWH